VFDEVFLVSGRIRSGLVIVGSCLARSALCRDVFDEVVFTPVRVRRSRLKVGT